MILFWKDEAGLELEEGRLCLSFVNTSDWHTSPEPREGLLTYNDLVEWAKNARIITGAEGSRLLMRAGQDRALAQAALEKAIRLREAAFRIFQARFMGKKYVSADLDVVNACLAESQEHLCLLPAGEGFARVWEADPIDLEILLWPVVRSTVDLLASPELAWVKICADDRGCGWAFLDTSRNHNRRWCSMDSCGNRAKAQRHYQRATSN